MHTCLRSESHWRVCVCVCVTVVCVCNIKINLCCVQYFFPFKMAIVLIIMLFVTICIPSIFNLTELYSYSRPVAVRQGKLLATTFYPELTDDYRWHIYFLQMILECKRPQWPIVHRNPRGFNKPTHVLFGNAQTKTNRGGRNSSVAMLFTDWLIMMSYRWTLIRGELTFRMNEMQPLAHPECCVLQVMLSWAGSINYRRIMAKLTDMRQYL